MTRVLTEAAVASLKPKSARYEERDGKVDGLRIVVQPTGAKGWQYRYGLKGADRRLRIGPYPAITLAEARRAALEAAAAVARGTDPAAEKAAASAAPAPIRDRVEDVAAEFIERYAKIKTRNWEETQRILEKDVVPIWRGLRLSEIGRADIHALLDGIIDRSAAIAANRTFAQIRKMSRWALQRGLIDHDPTAGLTPPSPERSRDRILTDAEIAAVWLTAGRLGFPFGPLIQMLILTGQRREEVGGMRWTEIDLVAKTWSLPAARTKNGRPHVIPLSGPSIRILSSLPRFDSDFVFSAGKTPPSGYSKAKSRVDHEIIEIVDGAVLPHWVLHDLRRSVVTGLARLGVEIPVIERVVNHASATFKGIVGTYQHHPYEIEKRAALELWARHIEKIVESGAAPIKLVNLAGAS